MPRPEMRRNRLVLIVSCLLALAGIYRRWPRQAGSDIVLENTADQSANAILTNSQGFLESIQARFLPGPDELPEAVRCLAEQDPASALAKLNEVPESVRPELASLIASSWAKTQPGLAAAWARDQLQGEAREKALLSLSADWAAVDPLSAAQCALDSFSGPRRFEFLQNVARQWSKDSVTATTWADKLPKGMERDTFLAGLCSVLTDTDPVQAATLASRFTDPQLQDETALTVVLTWGRSQPEHAAEWVKKFPEGELRQQALNSLATLCAEQNAAPSVLLDWPQGPELDQAIRCYLDEVLESEPARGVDVLAAISQDALRQEETQRVAQHWVMRDPSAASQWLTTVGFRQTQAP